jgi:hypothetical protein
MKWFRVEHYAVITPDGRLVHRFRTKDLANRVCKLLNKEVNAAAKTIMKPAKLL